MAPIDLHIFLFSMIIPVFNHIFVVVKIYWNSSSEESNKVFSLFFTFVTFDGIPCPGCPPGITEPLLLVIPTEFPCFEVSLVSSCVFTSPYCSVFLCRLPPEISIKKSNYFVYLWQLIFQDILIDVTNYCIINELPPTWQLNLSKSKCSFDTLEEIKKCHNQSENIYPW